MATFSETKGNTCSRSLFDETMDSDEETFEFADLIVNSAGFLLTLKAAIELDLLEIIAKAGPGSRLSAKDIAAELPTVNPDAPEMVDRILRLLATFSVVRCYVVSSTTGDDRAINSSSSTTRRYGLGTVAKYLVRDEDGVSLAPFMVFLQHKVLSDSWGKLKDAVLEGGIAFNKAYGVEGGVFEYTRSDPEYSMALNAGMLNHSTIVTRKILERFMGFENVKQLVDVGGGVGHTLKMIVTKYPQIKGINFDMPHVVRHAVNCPGVQHLGGDMFDRVPSGDAIILKWVLHCWSDVHCVKLLKNCLKALPDDGKVIVVDGIVPEAPRATNVDKCISLLDVLMLTVNQGGKERTEREFLALAKAAGFSTMVLACRVGSSVVMEIYK